MEEGLPETLVLVPFRMDGEVSPIRRPVADEPIILGGRSGRKVSDPGVDPPDSIGDIRTIHGDFITDKKVFIDIFLHPFPILDFFLNRPSPLGHAPRLKG